MQRKIALEVIEKTIVSNAYTNILLRSKLLLLKPINRAFVVEIVNGVLRNYLYLLKHFEKDIKPNTKTRLKIIICMYLYEMFFLNSKEYVLNEYVNLVSDKYEKSYINAICRKNIQKLVFDNNTLENISINYSLDLWIIKLLSKQYNDKLIEILETLRKKPIIYYRLNLKKHSYDELKDLNIDVINNKFFTSKNSLIDTRYFKNGYFYIQDINSSHIIDALDLQKDDVFLDCCSAPGSKLFNCLDVIEAKNAYCNDVETKRVELIAKKAKILGFNDINYLNYDARVLKDKLNITFDKILIDAPCSGLGVISRRSDIAFHIKPDKLDEIEKIQYEILNSSKNLLKKDGIIVYSTCTLNKKENSKQITKFLKENQNFKLIKEETIINSIGDCFYYASIKKIV